MEKERILLLAQLLASMKEATVRLQGAVKNQDAEHVVEVKKELMALQERIDQLL
jgi:hypothetical protein